MRTIHLHGRHLSPRLHRIPHHTLLQRQHQRQIARAEHIRRVHVPPRTPRHLPPRHSPSMGDIIAREGARAHGVDIIVEALLRVLRPGGAVVVEADVDFTLKAVLGEDVVEGVGRLDEEAGEVAEVDDARVGGGGGVEVWGDGLGGDDAAVGVGEEDGGVGGGEEGGGGGADGGDVVREGGGGGAGVPAGGEAWADGVEAGGFEGGDEGGPG